MIVLIDSLLKLDFNNVENLIYNSNDLMKMTSSTYLHAVFFPQKAVIHFDDPPLIPYIINIILSLFAAFAISPVKLQ